MMRSLVASFFLTLTLQNQIDAANFSLVEQEAILKSIERLSEKQREVEEELQVLKGLVGMHSVIDALELLEPSPGMAERIKVRIEDGLGAYKEKKYESAKEAFQKAWEEDPNDPIATFNLGMAYQRLGNTALAKRMFKATVELQPPIPYIDTLQTYLTGGSRSQGTSSHTKENDKLKEQRTELANMQKQADSYLHSTELAPPKRRAAVAHVLKKMVAQAKEDKELIKEYFIVIGERYSELELYDEALEVFERYEDSMQGEVLPDGYHGKILAVRERQAALAEILKDYQEDVPESRRARHAIQRDQEELTIFASQMHEFVQKANTEDDDFAKICQRLGEYRWGNRGKRHVIVVNRYEELLFSSLEGTLPLERYKDSSGRQFLRHIVQLSARLPLKEAGYTEVDLFVGGRQVPYAVLFTYVPKHETVIIVRYPLKDVNGNAH